MSCPLKALKGLTRLPRIGFSKVPFSSAPGQFAKMETKIPAQRSNPDGGAALQTSFAQKSWPHSLFRRLVIVFT